MEDEGQREAAWEMVKRGEVTRQSLRELRERPEKAAKAKAPQVEKMLAHVRKFRKQLERYAADDVVMNVERLMELEEEYRKLSELLSRLHRKQLECIILPKAGSEFRGKRAANLEENGQLF